jgi:hypothetical protein
VNSCGAQPASSEPATVRKKSHQHLLEFLEDKKLVLTKFRDPKTPQKERNMTERTKIKSRAMAMTLASRAHQNQRTTAIKLTQIGVRRS